ESSLDLRYATPQLVSQLSSAAAPAQFSLSAHKSQPASRFSLATAQCSLAPRRSVLIASQLSYGNLYFDGNFIMESNTKNNFSVTWLEDCFFD
ncbi:hypothetical protein MTR67_035325, partial [Solanum verrucosum]